MSADLPGGPDWPGSPGKPGGPGRPDEPAIAGRLLAPLARHSSLPAIVAAVAFALIAGGVAILVHGSGTATRELAADCGLINCGAAVPGPITIVSPQSHVSRAHRSLRHAPKPVAPSPSPTPSQAPQPAPLDVTVSYIPDRDHHRGHFEGRLTIVNHGSSEVSGWTVQLSFPRDAIDRVESMQGWMGVPFDHWQFSGDTLTISADTASETLRPGASQILTIHGEGSTIFPGGCTFNGTPCQS